MTTFRCCNRKYFVIYFWIVKNTIYCLLNIALYLQLDLNSNERFVSLTYVISGTFFIFYIKSERTV
jgi:hypothetical protein